MQRTASIFVVISMHISKHRHLLYDVQTQLVLHTFHKDPNKRSIQAYFFLKYDKYLPNCWVELSLNSRGAVKFFLVKLKQLPITCIDLTWIQTIEFHSKKHARVTLEFELNSTPQEGRWLPHITVIICTLRFIINWTFIWK